MTTTNQIPWYDCLGYTATIAESERAKGLGPKPNTATLRLSPMNFVNSGYEDDLGRVVPRLCVRLGEKLNPEAPVVIDDEVRLNQMFNVSPTPMPTHHEARRLARQDLEDLAFHLGGSGNGRAAMQRGYGFYQSIVGASHPDNGATWWNDYYITNVRVFGERPFTASLCVPVVSAYVAYTDDQVETRRLRAALDTSESLYNKRPWVFIGMRYPSGHDRPERRFDFVTAEHMTRALEIAYPRAAGIVLWTWNGYGPEGYRGKRDDNGYPTEIGGACGAGWDPNLPAWKAVEAFRAKLDAPKPKTETIKIGKTKPLFNPDERGRKA